jgi:hypothetical protein
MSGLVLDACLADRHDELRKEAQRHGLETVLDPRSVELSTLGGVTRSGVTALPWAGDTVPHTPALLGGASAATMIEALAKAVIDGGYSAVLAPTHYLAAGATDPWFQLDGNLVRALRRKLDELGGRGVCIYYPLAIAGALLRDGAQRDALISRLRQLPIDALWFRVHPFGTSSSGPLALRRYIEACKDFHVLEIPLVAEHTGTVGLALLTFGAVGGIEGGLTFGERYDVSGLIKPPAQGTPFSPPPRVYIEKLGTFLTREQARVFYENRQMKSLFACKVPGCCSRGYVDTHADPRRHFLLRRMGEVSYYSRPPEPLRAGLYLEEFLRPATDLALRATRVAPELDATRRRLEGWRNTLGAMHQQTQGMTFAMAPEGKRLHPRAHAMGA